MTAAERAAYEADAAAHVSRVHRLTAALDDLIADYSDDPRVRTLLTVIATVADSHSDPDGAVSNRMLEIHALAKDVLR